MKSLQYFGKQDLRFTDVEKPQIGPNEILLKVKKVGICGTDLHIYNGGMNVPTPLIIGHEFVGDIVEIGSQVTNLHLNKKAVAEHVVGCGVCEYCKAGLKNLCLKPTILGVHKSGALAEYMAIPAELVYELPDTMTYDDGVLVEPLSIAVYAVKKAKVHAGQTVAVVGQGPIGIFVDQVANAMGAKVYGIDINAMRIEYAKNHKYIVGSECENECADIVFEVVGRQETAQKALDLAKREGKVAILGVFEHDISINMMAIVKKELRVFGSWTCLDAFKDTITMLDEKLIKTDGLITHHYKFEDAIRAFTEAADTTTNRIKSVIEFNN